MLCGVKFLFLFFMFGIQWVMLKEVASLLFTWRNWLGKQFSNIWNMVPTCLMWKIWRERNTHTFEDIERPLDLLKSLLVGNLFEWSCIWVYTSCTSISDFLESVNIYIYIYFFWFVVIVSSIECSSSWIRCNFYSIKSLLPIKKKSIFTSSIYMYE